MDSMEDEPAQQQPRALADVVRKLCDRIDASYKLSVVDTRKSGEDGKKVERMKVSLTSALPNPCSMEELACAMPRSKYMAVGMSRNSVSTTPSLVVSSPDATIVRADATSQDDDDASHVYVPPFYEEVKSTGLIDVRFTNVAVDAGRSHPAPPGLLFSKSAQFLISNTVSRMRWLRLHSIDDTSLSQEGGYETFARSISYGNGFYNLKQRSVSPMNAADKGLLPYRVMLRCVSPERVLATKDEAHGSLGEKERKFYDRPDDSAAAAAAASDPRKAALECLDTWAGAYDAYGKDSQTVEGFMPFRKSYDTQFTAGGRIRGQTRALRRLATQAAAAGQARPQQQQQQQPATSADNNTRVLRKHSFYVAVRQEQLQETDLDQRQLYSVKITINDDVKFKPTERDADQRTAGAGRQSKDRVDISRLESALKRIPDRESRQPDGGGDIAVRTLPTMTLRTMLLTDGGRHADVVSAYGQFANVMARKKPPPSLLPYLRHLQSIDLLRPCVKLAYCIRECRRVLETNGSAEALAALQAGAVATEVSSWGDISASFLQHVDDHASELVGVQEYAGALESRKNDSAYEEWHPTADADGWGIDVVVSVMPLQSRADEKLSSDFTSISPLNQAQLRNVIYRAVCRLTCKMNTAENARLKSGAVPYGVGVGE